MTLIKAVNTAELLSLSLIAKTKGLHHMSQDDKLSVDEDGMHLLTAEVARVGYVRTWWDIKVKRSPYPVTIMLEIPDDTFDLLRSIDTETGKFVDLSEKGER